MCLLRIKIQGKLRKSLHNKFIIFSLIKLAVALIATANLIIISILQKQFQSYSVLYFLSTVVEVALGKYCLSHV